jgi:hypothetical protein
MRILRILVAFVLVVSGVVSTVGSGGGGGGDDVDWSPLLNLVPGSPPTSVDITTANAQDVSATVVQAIDQVFDLAAKTGGQIFPSSPAASNLLSGHSKFALLETVVTTGESLTDACAVSGTVTVSGDPMNDPVTMSMEDRFNLVFDACDDGDGYTLDGSFSLKVMELYGDLRTEVFRLRYLLLDIGLTVASGADSYTASANGFSLAWDSRAFPMIILTPSPFSLQTNSQDDVYSWPYGESSSLTVNADISPITTLREARAIRMKSDFPGDNLDYETIVPLQATDNQDPESGEILVTGSGTVRIVIVSGASVRLEIDVDCDGTVDDYQYTTWPALRG